MYTIPQLQDVAHRTLLPYRNDTVAHQREVLNHALLRNLRYFMARNKAQSQDALATYKPPQEPRSDPQRQPNRGGPQPLPQDYGSLQVARYHGGSQAAGGGKARDSRPLNKELKEEALPPPAEGSIKKMIYSISQQLQSMRAMESSLGKEEEEEEAEADEEVKEPDEDHYPFTGGTSSVPGTESLLSFSKTLRTTAKRRRSMGTNAFSSPTGNEQEDMEVEDEQEKVESRKRIELWRRRMG